MTAFMNTFVTIYELEISYSFNPRMVGTLKSSPHPRIGHLYPLMMIHGTIIPYLKKIQKTKKSHGTPLEFC